LKTPAKVNLSLEVLGRREDGYHEVSSVMQAVALFDTVAVASDISFAGETAPAGSARQDSGSGFFAGIRCSNPSVPEDGANLAVRAAFLLRECVDAPVTGTVEIDLLKNIPVSAGLAGGSADAAAVLLALARLWDVRAALPQIAEIGGKLGVDVPFCVYACAAANPGITDGLGFTRAHAEGAGDILTRLRERPVESVLLVKPDIAVPTAEIYEAYDAFRKDASPVSGQCPAGFRNDLQPVTAARYPIVAEIFERMREICESSGSVLMSGSGPTVFACFQNRAVAEAAEARAREAFPEMFVLLTETL